MTPLAIFSVVLHPAEMVGGRPAVVYGRPAEPAEARPRTRFGALSAKGVVAFVEDFAQQHGKPCKASVYVEQGQPPSGFRAATARLFYNMEANEE